MEGHSMFKDWKTQCSKDISKDHPDLSTDLKQFLSKSKQEFL